MRVVADSHALVWYSEDLPPLSDSAREAMERAEAHEALVVSVASLVDLWYVVRTTQAVSEDAWRRVKELVVSAPGIHLQAIDFAVVDAYTMIDRDAMRDPWDRFIVATANALAAPLVTRDRLITKSGLVETIW